MSAMLGKHYTRADYDPFIGPRGKPYDPAHPHPLPNVEEVGDVAQFLSNMAAIGHSWRCEWGYSRTAADNYPSWTMFFLTPAPNMGMDVGGTGYAVRYERSEGKVYSFAICRHEKEEAPGADHRRGWHPGKCRLCGMDMTIDSGD